MRDKCLSAKLFFAQRVNALRQLLTRVFGSRNERLVRGYARAVRAANQLEPQIQELGDEALRARTEEFRQRLKAGATLDELLPEAFAVVREAARRTLQMRHFDVQLIGGIVLHKGMISEMRTGEGKTLVATLPAYLNALGGEGVHIVTVNEYLAQRDRKSTRLNSSHSQISYAVFCLKKKKRNQISEHEQETVARTLIS